MRVREGLEQTATGALRRMASALGLPSDDGTLRGELVDRLSERLGDATYLAQQVQALSDEQRQILTDAFAAGGELRGLLLERDRPAEAEDLVDRGLLFRVFASAGPRRGEVFAVPEEVLALLPTPSSPDPLPLTDAPSERRATDPAFSLFCLASAITRGTDVEDEVGAWSVEPGNWPAEARWAFLRHVGIGSGLLVHQADGALVAGPALARGLDDPPSAADRFWRAYLRDRTWSELTHALGADAEFADTVQLREALVNALAAAPEGEWLEINAISDWLQRAQPALVREQLSPRGVLEFDAADWSQLEVPLLTYLLLGPLYWLGRIATSPDGARIQRRSPAGYSAEPCTWEDAHLIAPARTHLGTLLEAERYLILRERSRLSRYELVQSHVAAALGTGGSIAECRQLLERLSQAPLPSSVGQRLTSWQTRYGALTLRPAVLVEARSQPELDDALSDERIRRMVRARLGPTAIEVPAADALQLATLLRETGHLPQIDAALRLSADPRRAYASLVDQQVLEWLLVALLAFQSARPEQLAQLEGASSLVERLTHQFPPERLRELRAEAARLSGELHGAPAKSPPRRGRRRRTR